MSTVSYFPLSFSSGSYRTLIVIESCVWRDSNCKTSVRREIDPAMSAEKEIRDSDLVVGKLDDSEHLEAVRQDALHHGHLSAEELEIEKKLRRKIDMRVMPVLITIYLMNYIDRYVTLQHARIRY